MEPATASVRIKRPRAEVQALIADLSRHQEYLDHFLVDWTIASEDSRGAGAVARLRAKGGGGDDAIEIEIASASADAIVIETRSGRRGRRRMRLQYALADVAEAVTQVTFTLELLEGSIIDQATWPLPRAHLERQYGQAMLRLKGLLEGAPR
ncbi:MAG: hypothetical protein QOJ46_969 [bacterium]|jgi:hypothetical protein